MSADCCGPNDENKEAVGSAALPVIQVPGAAGQESCGCGGAGAEVQDACCSPAESLELPSAAAAPQFDACGCEIRTPEPGEPVARLYEVREIQLAALSGVLLVGGVGLGAAGLDTAGGVAEAGALVAGGLTFIPQSARALLSGRLSVGTLMMVAAIGAVLLGELAEAATLAFLFAISEALESYAMTRTRQGLRALMELAPSRATVRRDGTELEVATDELVIGDVLVVRPGERVATDGVITSGRSALDFSAITGESIAVERGPGETVFAAAINGSAALEVQVSARSADNSLARVVRVVEEAQRRKGSAERLSERVARPLVPGVLVVAAVIAVVGSLVSGDPSEWIERALVVLVAASPCAFAIAVPVTVVSAIGAATRSGVLIKGGAALEALAGVRAVALDKTGTLTRNEPRVIEVVPADARDEVLAVAAALEARSDHPLAAAILAATGGDVAPGADVQSVTGSGLTGTVEGQAARLGRPGFIDAGDLAGDVARLQHDGATVVLVEHAGRVLGAIAVRDELRPEARKAIELLQAGSVREVAMLTGDNAATAQALAAQAGVALVHADLMPQDKVTVIEEMQRRAPVAMVGDGINDAPALATAHVGIAMGAAGSDVAIEAADVALMGSDLRALPDTLHHARRAGRIMRQNLVLSGLILIALVPLAGAGVLGLATVVAVHEFAELIVIVNGVRAARRTSFRHRGNDQAQPPTPTATERAPKRDAVAAGV